MKLEKIKHIGVKPDGTFKTGVGSVETKGLINMSADSGGCGVPGCRCSPGHWITVLLPRSKGGIVEGIKVNFENKTEMDNFLKLRLIIGDANKK